MKKSWIFILLISFVSLISLVNAVSVGGPYSEDRPLIISPGETKIFNLSLQNRAGEVDVKFRAEIINGSDIVSFIDSNPEYFIAASPTSEAFVNLKVKAPKAKNGTEYYVKIKFQSIPLDTDKPGMVQIAVGLSWEFNVILIESPEYKEAQRIRLLWIIFSLALVLAVIIVIYLLVRGYDSDKKSFSRYS
ncbi:MAG: hypothetical protein WC438_02005 [Candidatus Pacearchaeota archaeon]